MKYHSILFIGPQLLLILVILIIKTLGFGDFPLSSGCPLSKFEDDSAFCFYFSPLRFFLGEGASGTICSTMGCNFTRQCTFALKLLLFPPTTPRFAPVPLRAAMTSWCHGTTAKTNGIIIKKMLVLTSPLLKARLRRT